LKPLSNEEWDQLSRHLMQEAYTTKSDLNRVWASSPVRVQWAQEAAQSAQQAALAAKKEKERQVAGSVLTGTHRGGPVGTQKNQSPKDLDDAVRLAYQELREQGLSLFT